MTGAATEELAARWLEQWPAALAAWGPTTRMADPVLHLRRPPEAPPSFAWFDGATVRVHINLTEVVRLRLTEHAVAIFAHEIGHHVLAPADARTRVAVAHRTRLGLVDHDDLVPLIANLWQDMVINDRLERTGGASMVGVWRDIRRSPSGPPDPLMDLVLRADELLWRLPTGTLTPAATDHPDREAYALLLSRLVRAYRNDVVGGAAGFAALVRTYLADELAGAGRSTTGCADATGPAGVPAGLATDRRLAAPVLHPALDPAVLGELAGSGQDGETSTQVRGLVTPHGVIGSSRDAVTPQELGRTLGALGSQLSPQEIGAALYRELATPHLVPFPALPTPGVAEPLLGGTTPWQPGEEIEDIDWSATMLASPVVVPGVTTRRREFHDDAPVHHTDRPVHLDLYLDSSGSMPNPTVRRAPVVLAGAVLALSALRAGARVRVTIWSGPGQVASTPGFLRDSEAVMLGLMEHYGGGTSFPLHVLRDTYLDDAPPARDRTSRRPDGPIHLAVVSDAGVSTMFPTKGEDVGLAARALAQAGGGGSLILDAPARALAALPDTTPFDVYGVSEDEELPAFAAEFARRWWAVRA